MQRIREAAGARYERLELNALVQRVEVTDHRYTAAEELAGRWPQLSAAEILQSPYVLIGTVDQIVEDLQSRRERWGMSYYVVFERDMDAFAPVVARLAGTSPQGRVPRPPGGLAREGDRGGEHARCAG